MDPNSLVLQYLDEAHATETALVTNLKAHIAMTTRAPYKKRLKEHLKETKAHARGLERRIKKLGGGGQIAQTTIGKVRAKMVATFAFVPRQKPFALSRIRVRQLRVMK